MSDSIGDILQEHKAYFEGSGHRGDRPIRTR